MKPRGAGGVFEVELLEARPGFALLHVSGPGAADLFRHEPGGHRWQRIPPSEKRGRVHTSTVTVAVLTEPTEAQLRIDSRDLEIKTCRASGPGGQNVNKTSSAVHMTHIPTGLHVRCETERSQHRNKELALSLLRTRLGNAQVTARANSRNEDRRQQIGSGERGDKVRTIRVQDGQVTDHRLDVRISLERYLRGELPGSGR